MKKIFSRRIAALTLILALIVSVVPGVSLTAFAAGVRPMVIVDMLDRTYPIMHGSAGFLYGVSSDGVPTTSLLTPLKPKVLATKGALGTEHPYGDALDVAKTFLESGGEMVQMYNSNYYAIFGPTCTSADYAVVLETVIAPAVVAWKEQWKIDHHADPVTGIDDLGLDIDKAIQYLPINEGTPNSGAGSGENGFFNSWRMFYQAIKRTDPKATVAGPNDALYGHWRSSSMRGFLTYCHQNDCWPDIITWHQLDNQESRFADYPKEFADYKKICADLGREETQVVINEYAAMVDCGVPGRLINFFANFEENQVYACLPFWHQANNLNDIAADANEPNGAWWLYKWYGDMSGDLLRINRRNTPLTGLNAVSTIDDNKRLSTTLFGGVDGSSAVILKDLDKTETFKDATKVHVKIEATYFKSFNGMVEPETVIEGTFSLENGDLIIEMDDMKFSDAYNLMVTPAKDEDEVGNPLVAAYRGVYEAEDAVKVGGVSQTGDGKYYLSNGQGVVGFSTANGIDYKIDVPVDGRYKFEFVYGNELGLNRGNESLHKPLNQIQKLSVDGGQAADMIMKNTMERAWTGIHTEYVDLTAGAHTLSVRGSGNSSTNLLHDMLHVTYAGAYEQPLPVFDKVYEAEVADFNELASTAKTAVSTKADLAGYTGSGYVTGLNVNPVAGGGGIRWNVVVQESGLYNVSLRYQAAVDGTVNICMGNSARTFDGFVKSVNVVNTNGNWALVKATLYLEKGVNIVDIDAAADIALDNIRVRKADAASLSQEIKAVDAIPEGAKLSDVTYPVWDCRNIGTRTEPIPELFATTLTTNKTASTTLSPDGVNVEYVVGRSLTGDKDAEKDINKYLEFEVTVDTAGTYAMQLFHSNDEIFGTHSYNTKIIDKFASIKVNDQDPERYFFINSISRDTFKEKSVLIELEAGVNTIKVFNDDSWHNLKGLENSSNAQGAGHSSRGFANNYYMDKPGNIPLVNALPNLYKFVITPAALAAPLADTVVEHQVNIRATSGGTAIADKNAVVDGQNVTIALTTPTELIDVLVNGVSKKSALTDKGAGEFELAITNVKEDLDIQALFATETVIENDPNSPIVNNSFEMGGVTGWTLDTTGQYAVENNIFERYDSTHYLRLSGSVDYVATLSQRITVAEGGVYKLSFAMKNLGDSSSVTGDYNTIEFAASVGGKPYVYMPIAASPAYIRTEGMITIPEGGATVDFSVGIDAKAGFEAYLDSFTLEETDVTIAPEPGVRLLQGTIFGRTTDNWEKQDGPEKAFDGSNSTFYDGQGGAYAGMHMGLPYYLHQIRFVPRSSAQMSQRMNGNQFQGSSDGGQTWETLYTITSNPSNNPTVTTVNLTPTKAYSSFRIYSGNGSYCNIAELQFYGEMGDAAGALAELLDKAREVAAYDGWTKPNKTILEKSMAFAQSALDSGTVDLIIMVNATETLRYAISLAPPLPVPVDPNLAYFVDCGDHDPSTLSEGDAFGVYNRVSEQIYGADSSTGMEWGLVVQPFDTVISSQVSGSKGVFTQYTWASEKAESSADGISKHQSYRYARGQDGAGINPRSIAYKFELPAGTYAVEVGFTNSWNNASPVTVLLNGVDGGSTTVPSGGTVNPPVATNTNTINISADEGSGTGTLDLLLQSTAATIQVAYITIRFVEPEPVINLDVPCKKIVAGYAANLPATMTFDGESTEVELGLYKSDGALLQSVVITEDGSHTFKLGVDDAVSGTYVIKVMRGTAVIAQEAVECVAQPENLWKPTVTTGSGVTNITFASDVTFNASKKKATIGNDVVDIISVEGQVVTVGKEMELGQNIVISGVKYADLFPSYSFTFTMEYTE